MNYIVGNGTWGTPIDTGAGTLATDIWYHIIGTHNRTTSNLYINGAINGTVENLLDVGLTNLTVGARYLSESVWYQFNGSIDEIRIWNRSLSSDEVYQQYMSNLNKFNQTQWYLYINQSRNATANLSEGNYTYNIFASDLYSNLNETHERLIIIDWTEPIFTNISNKTFEHYAGVSYDINATDENGISCFFVNDSTRFNITCSGYLINKTKLSNGLYDLNITIYDTAANENYSYMLVNITDTTPPVFTNTSNKTSEFGVAFDYDLNATDSNNISCFLVNDSTRFNITCDGYMINNTNLSIDLYWLNITINDTVGNRNSSIIFVNVTDTTSPNINITYPANNTYTNNTGIDINYTVFDLNLDSCWYSNDSMTLNTTLPNCANITSVIWSESPHNVTIWVNDTYGNINSSIIFFTIDLNPPNFTVFANQTTHEEDAFGYDINATDTSPLSCFTVNDTTNFRINCSGYLENNTYFNQSKVDLYWLNITVNDSAGNEFSDVMWVNITDKGRLNLQLTYPTGDTNVSQNNFFQITVNISCRDNDCGDINLSLDPTSLSEYVFFDGFESGNLSSNWTAIGDPGIYNRTKVATSASSCGSPRTGTYFITFDSSTTSTETNILKTNYDFSDAENIILDFWHHESSDEQTSCSDHNGNDPNCDGYFFTCDGYRWYVLGNLGDVVSWTHVTVNVSSDSDFCSEVNSTFSIKFTQYDDYYCPTDGRMLDDINITYLAPTTSKSGLILMTNTSTPFYTNTTNPYNITLNNTESKVITWYVNATGTINSTHEFYVYANRTDDLQVGNITDTWNVTIREAVTDISGPSFNLTNQTIEYLYALGYNINATDDTAVYCFSVNDTKFTINCSGYLTNNTLLNVSIYWLNITANDTLGYETTKIMWVNVTNTTLPTFTNLANQTADYSDGLGYDIDATDLSNISCFTVNDTTNFKINCSGYLENKTLLNVSTYWLNITVNDTIGNENYGIIYVNITDDSTSPIVNITYPINGAIFNYTTTSVSLNVSTNENSTCFYTTDSGQTNNTMTANSSNTGFNATISTSPGITYTTNVYCNDSYDNWNITESVIFSLNASPSIGLDMIYPTSNINVSKNDMFNVSVNVSCKDRDCGEINVSLDPSTTTTSYGTLSCDYAGCTGEYTFDDFLGAGCTLESAYLTTNVEESDYDSSTEYIEWTKVDSTQVQSTCNPGVQSYCGVYYTCLADNDITSYAEDGSITVQMKISSGVNCCCRPYLNANLTLVYTQNCGKGLITTDTSATPFYTNLTNPYNLTLNENESRVITWWVNATGTLDTTHEFYIYANKTNAGIPITNVTSTWNTTIKDLTVPALLFYPDTTANGSHNLQRIITVNVSVSDSDLDTTTIYIYNSTELINSTTSTYIQLTNLTYGTYYFNATANDTSGNRNISDTRTLILNKPILSISRAYPTTNINASQNRWFNVSINVTCLEHNCGDINITLDPVSGIECGEITNCDFSQTGDCSNQDGTCTSIPGWTYYEITNNILGPYEQAQVSTTSNPFGDKGNWLQFGSTYTGSKTSGWKAYLYSDAFTANADYITYNFDGEDYDEWGYGLMIYEDGNETENYQLLTYRCPYSGSWDENDDVWGGCNDNSNTNPSAEIDQTVAIDSSLRNKQIRIKVWTGDGGSGDYGTAYIDDICLSDASGTCISTSKRVISTTPGTIPFWTNKSSNPYTINLNNTNSSIVTFYINTTGTKGNTYEFFAYAIIENDTSLRNDTTHWNVTITDATIPIVRFQSSTTTSGNHSQTYIYASVTADDDNMGNITIYLYNLTSLVNSTISSQSATSHSVNFTGLGDNTYYLNATGLDTSGNSDSTVTRTIRLDTVSPTIIPITPRDGYNTSSTSLNFTFYISDNSTNNCTLYMDSEGSVSYNIISYNSSVSPNINTSLNASNIASRLNSWYLSCIDSAGNTNTSTIKTFTVDSTAPQIIVSSPTANGSFGYLIYLKTEITDVLSSVESAWYYIYNNSDSSQLLSGGALNSTGDWDSTWNSSSFDGVEWNVTFSVFANDTLGNIANRNVSFYLDNNQPVIQLITPPASLTYYNSNFSLNLIVQDLSLNYTYYNISAEGSQKQYNSTIYETIVGEHIWKDNFNVSDSADGPYNITVYGRDSIGNSVNVSTFFIIDKSSPDLTITRPLDNEYVNTTYLNFNWTTSDNTSTTLSCNVTVSGITKKLYCANSTPCNYTFNGFSETTYNFNISCSDNASNKVITSSNFTIDVTFPLLSFTSMTTTAGNHSQNYIVINASVTEQNIDNLTIRLYNSSGTMINTSSTLSDSLFMNITDLAEGTYYINASINDSANHLNYTETRSIALDYVYPSSIISKNTSSLEYGYESIAINWTSSDNNIKTTIFNVTLPGGQVINSSNQSSGSVNLSSDVLVGLGTYTISLYSEDDAGNINKTTTIFTVDDTITPSVSFVNPDTKNYSRTWIFANATSNETSLSFIAIYLYNQSGLVNQNNGSTSPHAFNFTSLSDGVYYYNASVCDETKCNSSETHTLRLDTHPPFISFELPTPSSEVTSDSYISANISVSDNSIGMINITLYNSSGIMINSSTSFSTPFYYNFTNLYDDTVYLNATVNDTAGNRNSTITKIYSIDSTKPLISYAGGTEENNTYKIRSWIYVNVTAYDTNEANITFYLYNSSRDNVNSTTYIAGTRSINFTSLSDDSYYYNVTVRDTLNNQNTTSTRVLTLDSVYPTINITTPLNNTNTSNSNLTINYTASDLNLAYCWYSNDSMTINTTLPNCTTNLTNITWSEGNHNITIWVNDSVGHENSSSVSFNIDLTSPTITINTPLNNTNSTDENLTINYTASDLNLAYCWYSNDSMTINTTLLNCTTNITNVTWSDGQHNITIWVNDSAGNKNYSSITFTIDTLYPTITITTPLNNTNSTDENLSINYTASDANLAYCWYANDSMSLNTTLPNCTTNLTNITWSEGNHNITIWVNDTFGNKNSSSISFFVDLTPPNVTLETPIDNYTNNSVGIATVHFNCSVTDEVALANISLYLTNSTNESFSLNQTTTITGKNNSANWSVSIQNGNYTWNCLAYDSAGNYNWSANRTMLINTSSDLDGDNIPDILDKLYYNETYVNKSGVIRLNITVGGNKTNQSFSDVQEVRFYDQNTLLFNFSFNFSKYSLDLSNVTIIKSTNYILINLSAQLQTNKTIYMTDSNFMSLCVKDAEINSIDQMSAGCTGSNETDFTLCLGGTLTLGNITCTDQGTTIQFDSLMHSAIRGTPLTTPAATSSPASGGSFSGSAGITYSTITTTPTSRTLREQKNYFFWIDPSGTKTIHTYEIADIVEGKIRLIVDNTSYDLLVNTSLDIDLNKDKISDLRFTLIKTHLPFADIIFNLIETKSTPLSDELNKEHQLAEDIIVVSAEDEVTLSPKDQGEKIPAHFIIFGIAIILIIGSILLVFHTDVMDMLKL
ncbi:MAG: hypothetical protein ABIJ08_03995 [Nanoarchaeota archaeon]